MVLADELSGLTAIHTGMEFVGGIPALTMSGAVVSGTFSWIEEIRAASAFRRFKSPKSIIAKFLASIKRFIVECDSSVYRQRFQNFFGAHTRGGSALGTKGQSGQVP